MRIQVGQRSCARTVKPQFEPNVWRERERKNTYTKISWHLHLHRCSKTGIYRKAVCRMWRSKYEMNLKSVIKWRWYQLKIASRPLPLLFYMYNALETRIHVHFNAIEWNEAHDLVQKNRTLHTYWNVIACLLFLFIHSFVVGRRVVNFVLFFPSSTLHSSRVVSSATSTSFLRLNGKKSFWFLKRKQTCNCIISNTNLFMHKWMNEWEKVPSERASMSNAFAHNFWFGWDTFWIASTKKKRTFSIVPTSLLWLLPCARIFWVSTRM